MNAPTVMSVACTGVRLKWSAFKENYDVGNGPVITYRLLERSAAVVITIQHLFSMWSEM